MFGIDDALIGGALGAIGSSVLDLGVGIFRDNNSNSNARDNAEEAWERSQASYASRYQTTVNDMRLAGLNPILAASGGFSVGGQPQAPIAPTFQYSGSHADIASSARNFQEIDESKQRIEESVQRVDLMSQEVLNKVQDIEQSKAMVTALKAKTDVDDQTVMRIGQEILNMSADTAVKWQQLRVLTKEIGLKTALTNLASAQGAESLEKAKEIRALVDSIRVNTSKTFMELSELGRTSELFDSPIGPVLKFMQEVSQAVPSLGVILGGKNKSGGRR